MNRYATVIFAALAVALAPQPCAAAAPTVLEVRWSVTLPKRLADALTAQAVTDWEGQQGKELAEALEKPPLSRYFPFWSFSAPQAAAGNRPTLRVVVKPSRDTTVPTMTYAVEVHNVVAVPQTLRSGKLFDGAAYADFEGNGARYGLAAIAAKVTQLLCEDEREQFRTGLIQKVPVADGIVNLPGGKSGALPHPFDQRTADSYRSVFVMRFMVNGTWVPVKGTGDGRHGTPPQLRLAYDPLIDPGVVLVAIKVLQIVSDSEEGLPSALDRLP